MHYIINSYHNCFLAVKKILEKDHLFQGTPVNIYSYYTSLCSALYGKDRLIWILPKPFTYEIHPVIREFLQKKGQISSISNQMSSHFCQMNMDTDEVLFNPLPALVRQKGISKKHRRQLEAEYHKYFQKHPLQLWSF